MMKKSNYTILFDVQDNEYYIYNTLSNSLIEIDKESYDLLNGKDQYQLNETSFDQNLWSVLVDKGFVTDNDDDDILIYKSAIMDMRSENTMMHLTLAPTMDCVFNCHYCFEQHKSRSYMTSELIDAIIKYVTSIHTLNEIKVTWFGGEPLMAIDKMEEFYNKFSKVWKHKYDSNIITTGYHLNEENIEILRKIKISSAQITLDGGKESHNAVKSFEGEHDAFSRTINNIDLLTKKAPEINTVIRVNILKKNAHEYVELAKMLRKRLGDCNWSITPAFVKDKGSSKQGQENSANNPFFNRIECVKFIMHLFHKHRLHSTYLLYPSRFINECAIRNKFAISFDSDGNVYKCWEVIGNTKYAIGKLNTDGEIIEGNYRMLNRQLYGADPLDSKKCIKCKYLPLCNGGCPIERIYNEYEDGVNDVCCYYKNYMPDFLTAHILMKKSGFENY